MLSKWIMIHSDLPTTDWEHKAGVPELNLQPPDLIAAEAHINQNRNVFILVLFIRFSIFICNLFVFFYSCLAHLKSKWSD